MYKMLSTSMLPSRVHDLYILISIVVTVSDVNTDIQQKIFMRLRTGHPHQAGSGILAS